VGWANLIHGWSGIDRGAGSVNLWTAPPRPLPSHTAVSSSSDVMKLVDRHAKCRNRVHPNPKPIPLRPASLPNNDRKHLRPPGTYLKPPVSSAETTASLLTLLDWIAAIRAISSALALFNRYIDEAYKFGKPWMNLVPSQSAIILEMDVRATLSCIGIG
jgi:hypothetical protein